MSIFAGSSSQNTLVNTLGFPEPVKKAPLLGRQIKAFGLKGTLQGGLHLGVHEVNNEPGRIVKGKDIEFGAHRILHQKLLLRQRCCDNIFQGELFVKSFFALIFLKKSFKVRLHECMALFGHAATLAGEHTVLNFGQL